MIVYVDYLYFSMEVLKSFVNMKKLILKTYTYVSQNRVICLSCIKFVVLIYRFRPYCSWLDTQSEEAIAEANEISPANTAPATISANL